MGAFFFIYIPFCKPTVGEWSNNYYITLNIYEMAKISLKKKLDLLGLIILAFTGIVRQKDKSGKSIAILTLADPIAHVRGSQEFMIDGVSRPMVATDVTEIKVHEDDFVDGLEWDDQTDTGSYEGSDLLLDVSQNGITWLRKTSFAQGSQEFRANSKSERLRKALGLAPAAKGTDEKPTGTIKPVDTANVGS